MPFGIKHIYFNFYTVAKNYFSQKLIRCSKIGLNKIIVALMLSPVFEGFISLASRVRIFSSTCAEEGSNGIILKCRQAISGQTTHKKQHEAVRTLAKIVW